MKRYYLLIILVCLFTVASFGQRAKSCKAGTLLFGCPESFVRLPAPDASSALFKQKDGGSVLYFFVSDASGQSPTETIMKAVGKQISSSSVFQWKKSREAFMMDMETKYQKELEAWLGFDGQRLVTIKTASFTVKGKRMVFGYAWEENDVGSASAAKRLFDHGEALRDDAVGCNAVVTAFNSVTKEFKGKLQYCSLMAAPAVASK